MLKIFTKDEIDSFINHMKKEEKEKDKKEKDKKDRDKKDKEEKKVKKFLLIIRTLIKKIAMKHWEELLL